jgi:hypothetical protein
VEKEKRHWLKRLQSDSWEPEILISGIVIYGLFKIFPFVDELKVFLQNYVSEFFSQGSIFDFLIALLKVSISWLIIGFITHLFLRSFWVAYIGLSYVYNNEIKYKSLRYKEIFLKDKWKEKSISASIERLESVCSTIFSVSILFFMNVLGLVFLILIVGFGVYIWLKLFPEKSDFDIFNIFLFTILGIYLLDYLTSGLLKRIPYFNKVYYPIYKIISFFALAPAYRKIYYTFITNHKKWKVFLFLIVFIFITYYSTLIVYSGRFNALALNPDQYAENMIRPEFFLDEADGNLSNQFWLPSSTVNNQTLEVFVVHSLEHEEKHIKPLCDYADKIKSENADKNNIKLECLDEFFLLTIDGKPISSDFLYTKSAKTTQNGLKYFIPIDTLQRGNHSISLYYNLYNKKKDTAKYRLQGRTAFYKSSEKAKY